MSRLGKVDLSKTLSKEESEEQLADAQRKMLALRLALGGKFGSGEIGPPVCVLFEGWDASGKGGAIKRLVAPMDPRHVRVAQFSAPTEDEKRHHFLHRFVSALPGWGGFSVLDRSWYGRVLVERVEGFAREDEWRRAYSEIVSFERGLVAEGMILVKLWLHVSAEEQLKRFEKRQDDPLKRWKLTDEDWRNREKRPLYEPALEDMFEHTDHEDAPWHVIPGDSKHFARVDVIETVIERITSEAPERGFAISPAVRAVLDGD